jgi:hypothetical protein
MCSPLGCFCICRNPGSSVQEFFTEKNPKIQKKIHHMDCNDYGGYTLRSEIEAPLITREVLPETYFLLVIIAADAQARPFLQFQASC